VAIDLADQHRLDQPQRLTVFEQVRGKRVPQHMWRNMLVDTRARRGQRDRAAQRRRLRRAARHRAGE